MKAMLKLSITCPKTSYVRLVNINFEEIDMQEGKFVEFVDPSVLQRLR